MQSAVALRLEKKFQMAIDTKVTYIGTLNAGDRIRHDTFGEGLVTKCELSASDVVVTISFDHTYGSKRFLLSQTPMIRTEEYKALPYKAPPKVKERKSPRSTYTTEFKIKVAKQALVEGRTAVRQQYNLPETTLRAWVKALD